MNMIQTIFITESSNKTNLKYLYRCSACDFLKRCFLELRLRKNTLF